jgi:regulator of replication initiation timing
MEKSDFEKRFEDALSLQKMTEKMTVKEVSTALGVDVSTINKHVKTMFPEIVQHGVATYLNEAQVTAISMKVKEANAANLGKPSEVGNTNTDLEIMIKAQEVIGLLARRVSVLQTENKQLGFENEQLKIELSEAKEWYTVKRVLIETGREYAWKPLKEYSVKKGYDIERVYDKNFGNVNAYHINVWHDVYGLEL